jgi:hypothetical protein
MPSGRIINRSTGNWHATRLSLRLIGMLLEISTASRLKSITGTREKKVDELTV